jgi:predicted small secreted protein
MTIRAFTTLFAALALLAACETIEGAGQDIQTAGRTITGTAQQAQR